MRGIVIADGAVSPGRPQQANRKLFAVKSRLNAKAVVFERSFVKKRDVIHEKSKMSLINTAGIQGQQQRPDRYTTNTRGNMCCAGRLEDKNK
jgi:hypothetical protein